MKCFGNSMLPILSNPSLNTYQKESTYNVGDIVFCKVRGRYIDAHKVIKIVHKGITPSYLIANNHGHENGWTTIIYGRVIESSDSNGRIKRFDHKQNV